MIDNHNRIGKAHEAIQNVWKEWETKAPLGIRTHSLHWVNSLNGEWLLTFTHRAIIGGRLTNLDLDTFETLICGERPLSVNVEAGQKKFQEFLEEFDRKFH